MRIIKRYEDFLKFKLNEAFDLKAFITKEKIHPIIVDMSTEIINEWFGESNNMPSDISKKKDNLILWFARNIKKRTLMYLDAESPVMIKYIKKAFNKENLDDKDIITVKNAVLNGVDIPNIGDSNLNELIYTMIYRQLYEDEKTAMKDYIFSSSRNIQVFKINFMSTFEEMIAKSKEWHDSLKASGNVRTEEGYIIKKYNDGFYWVDLLTNDSDAESNAMGHCGRTSADTLLSLRKESNGKIEPFVTIAIDYEHGIDVDGIIEAGELPTYSTIFQCKGKNNRKPVEKYHSYIIDLLLDENLGIEEIDSEYSPQDDFQLSDIKDMETVKLFIDKKPGLFFSDGVQFMKYIDNPEFVASIYEKAIENPDFGLKYDFPNLFTLVTLKLIPFEQFTKYFPKVDKMVGNVMYMKTDFAEFGLSHFSKLYSEASDNRYASNREMVKQLSDDVVDIDYTSVEDVLQYHDIDSDNLHKIYDSYFVEEYETFEEFEESYKEIVAENYEVSEFIQDAYRFATEETYITHKDNIICEPLYVFSENEEYKSLDYMALIKSFMVHLISPECNHISVNDDAVDLYENIFEAIERETGEDEYLKFDVPYYGFDTHINDKQFNAQLKELI